MIAKLQGHFKFKLYDALGQLIDTRETKNLVTTPGANHALDVVFGGGSQIDPWYIGLINATPTPAIVNTDTLASHPGWVEFTNYTGNRQAWDDAAASARAKTSDTNAVFPITSAGTIWGAFVASVATGTSGTLWSAASFTIALPVSNGNNLNVVYSLSYA